MHSSLTVRQRRRRVAATAARLCAGQAGRPAAPQRPPHARASTRPARWRGHRRVAACAAPVGIKWVARHALGCSWVAELVSQAQSELEEGDSNTGRFLSQASFAAPWQGQHLWRLRRQSSRARRRLSCVRQGQELRAALALPAQTGKAVFGVSAPFLPSSHQAVSCTRDTVKGSAHPALLWSLAS